MQGPTDQNHSQLLANAAKFLSSSSLTLPFLISTVLADREAWWNEMRTEGPTISSLPAENEVHYASTDTHACPLFLGNGADC